MKNEEYDELVNQIDEMNQMIDVYGNQSESVKHILADLQSENFGYIFAVLRGKMNEENKLAFEDTVALYEKYDDFQDERITEISKQIKNLIAEYLKLVSNNLEKLLLNTLEKRDNKISSLKLQV